MPVEIRVPQVGESITEVEISEWLKKEGSSVEQDETVATLETDKASVELSAPSKGVISQILKKSGETAKVGDVVAMIEDKGGSSKGSGKQDDKSDSKESESKEAKSKESESKEQKASQPSESKQKEKEKTQEKQEDKAEDKDSQEQEKDEDWKIMPAARRMLEENNISADEVQGTGPAGRILKEDVQRYLEDKKESEKEEKKEPQTTSGRSSMSDNIRSKLGSRDEEEVPMTMFRRRVAERLVQAQQTGALLTTFNEVDMSSVMDLRNKFKEEFQKRYGVKLGIMSFFVKAAVEALKQLPQLNAEIRETNIIYKHYFDIGIAIGGGKGLVVPVLRNAENMTFADIESQIVDYGKRAKEGKIEIDELKGGTFTISNGGVYGSMMSTPIINPPQSGVLGMHAIQDRAMVVNGEIVVRPMMYIALTYDHRIVDGREAVTFLKSIKQSIEDPARMILEL